MTRDPQRLVNHLELGTEFGDWADDVQPIEALSPALAGTVGASVAASIAATVLDAGSAATTVATLGNQGLASSSGAASAGTISTGAISTSLATSGLSYLPVAIVTALGVFAGTGLWWATAVNDSQVVKPSFTQPHLQPLGEPAPATPSSDTSTTKTKDDGDLVLDLSALPVEHSQNRKNDQRHKAVGRQKASNLESQPSLSAEIRLLKQVRTALNEKDPRAHALLAQYLSNHPQGALRSEYESLALRAKKANVESDSSTKELSHPRQQEPSPGKVHSEPEATDP